MKKSFLIFILLLFILSSLGYALKAGQIVAAKWGNSYYIAMIVNSNGSDWDIVYGDGYKKTINSDNIIEIPGDPKLKIGDKVLAIWKNGIKFYSGEVMDTCKLSYKVKWDDGSSPSWVPATRIIKK